MAWPAKTLPHRICIWQCEESPGRDGWGMVSAMGWSVWSRLFEACVHKVVPQIPRCQQQTSTQVCCGSRCEVKAPVRLIFEIRRNHHVPAAGFGCDFEFRDLAVFTLASTANRDSAGARRHHGLRWSQSDPSWRDVCACAEMPRRLHDSNSSLDGVSGMEWQDAGMGAANA